MIRCIDCGTESQDSCQFCDECGRRLIREASVGEVPAYVPPATSPAARVPMATMIEPINVTSIGQEIRPVLAMDSPKDSPELKTDFAGNGRSAPDALNAKLLIERGDGPVVEFKISGVEAIIGRWDADNGVFPDVDLDSHDSEAKVSRKHARIRRNGSDYTIEDVGSTNGTYVNRGRRLLPGTAQVIKSGDEIIVGKTFLRFQTLD